MKYGIGILAVCVTVMCSEPRALAVDQAADKAAIENAIKSYTAADSERGPLEMRVCEQEASNLERSRR